MNRKKNVGTFFVGFILAVLSLLLLSTISEAQTKYPTRPISFICPWGAGGGTDQVARMLAVLLEKDLGQPVTVVNRTGGSGAVGHTAGATAAPDGYTMTIVTVEITMMHWMGLAKVNYKDFKPVALLNFDPSGVNVRVDAPWKTLKELLDYAKANPGKLKATGTGKGGIWDLARAGMLKTAGISIDAIPWVPSEGAAPGLAELVAGGIQVVTCSLPEARSMIEAKRVRALAIMGDKRADLFPDVPTLRELGISWSMGAWRGVGVPKDTPDDVVKVLEKSLEKAVASAEFKNFMVKNGFGIMWKPAVEYGKFMADGDREMGAIMKEVGLVK
jgi:tripartite-type tricarboxylate transporter receptor subunit TctC